MKIKVKHLLLFTVILIALHILALKTGMYTCENQENCIVWWDNVTHVLGGVYSGMIWIWFLQRKRSDILTKKNAILISSMAFVLVVALLWELFEYSFVTWFTEYAYKAELYSPSLIEALQDIISNLVGGVLFMFFFVYNRKNVMKK